MVNAKDHVEFQAAVDMALEEVSLQSHATN